MPFDAEELARTVLVRLIPSGRYRIAAPNDARFAAFAPGCVRVAYRQQGAEPSFVLFVGSEADPRAAAAAAAEWAAANWRPNAVQKRVRPGVLAIQVGSGVSAPPGPVTGTAVPAAVWTVDPATGRVETSGRPPGAPSAGEVKRAASALARGLPAASVGELDYAEREIMHPRTAGMPAVLTGGLAILLVLFAARYGFGALYQVLLYTGLLSAGVNPLLALGGLVANLLLVAGIVLSVALLLNFRGAALRAPGFSSPRSGTRTAAWVGLAAAMAVLVAGTNYALPRWLAGQQRQAQAQTLHISVTAADDGTQVQVSSGGDVRVDLRAWPGDEWPGVRFSVSNPSVLGASSLPAAGDAPVATFDALSAGASRIDADSRDGRYSFELRVMVVR